MSSSALAAPGSTFRDLTCFAIGFGTALLVIASVALSFRRSDIYNVDHWKLNIRLPPTSMWMNMGYWKTTDNALIHQFDEACQRLLEEVLSTAGLLPPTAGTRRAKTDVAVLDLGIGCGDQTKSLVQLLGSAGRNLHYVGLTNVQAQVNIATRLKDNELESKAGVASIEISLADAAQPSSWSSAIHSTLLAQKAGPSRIPLFRYAAAELDASIMAFDLLLSDKATPAQRLIAQAIGVASQCPWGTFLPLAEYRAQLVGAGFDPELIETRDVTPHVFRGLVDFIDRQAESLSTYGIALTRYRVFQKVLKFFVASGVVRAVIIVAKRR
ncbi:hypothetical protein PFICI_06807 [Pestalotiopsis fici W106-1]|uniref:Methyltransferase domain-containing protein n=1 Tax=Pestalotiopsis fici (strain W106-1 / CGMCC3.15140) TaxID=1229662 RepID=W3X6Y1_PESFW|nr:uncharacterized protein PFICI_06807 [Pestalotiopsis fici W106-1]ETS81805.1 hypothetical protein PFICI_06807 [Pestalotiopsis fici W106-1]